MLHNEFNILVPSGTVNTGVIEHEGRADRPCRSTPTTAARLAVVVIIIIIVKLKGFHVGTLPNGRHGQGADGLNVFGILPFERPCNLSRMRIAQEQNLGRRCGAGIGIVLRRCRWCHGRSSAPVWCQ